MSLPSLLPSKAIYSMADDRALLLVDRTKASDQKNFSCVITLKTSALRYIKLRNIPIQEAKSNSSGGEWTAVGSPPKFYLLKSRLMEEFSTHNNPKKYGPWEEIGASIDAFQTALRGDIRQVAAQEAIGEGKLTTDMSPSGKLRALEKRMLATGTYKQVDAATLLYGEAGKIAKAKVRNTPPEMHLPANYLKENVEYVTALRQESVISKALAGVPHLLSVQACPGQNINKARLDMPLLEGGPFYPSIARTPPTSAADRNKRIKYLSHIAQAVAAIHKAGYTYNDLKLENCLIDTATNEGVLGDLGSIRPLHRPGTMGSYPAPECSINIPHKAFFGPSTTENDCWAFGVLAYDVLHSPSHAPMGWSIPTDQIKAAAKELVSHLNPSDRADQQVAKLLSFNPESRPEMAEVFQILSSIPTVVVKKATRTYKKNITHNFLTRQKKRWTTTKRPKHR